MPHLNDATKLCFAVAITALVVGALGAIVNLLAPRTTTVDALLIVAAIYAALGTMERSRASAAITFDRPREVSCSEQGVTEVDVGREVEPGSLQRAA